MNNNENKVLIEKDDEKDLFDELTKDLMARDIVWEMHRQKDKKAFSESLKRSYHSLKNELYYTQKRLRDMYLLLNGIPSDEKSVKEFWLKMLVENKAGSLYGLGLKISKSKSKKEDGKNRQVDCEKRQVACKGQCCRLRFSLTREEILGGIIEWDPNEPFMIRRSANGFCFHYDESMQKCTIYENRPGICRLYSCEKDKRIWENFEKILPKKIKRKNNDI